MINLISYYGGKVFIRKWIISHFPRNYERLHYIEPFAGSLAVLFAKKKSELESINDIDNLLINLWEVMRDKDMSNQLFEMSKHTLHSEKLNKDFSDTIKKSLGKEIKDKDKVKLAYYYFYCNRLSFQKMTYNRGIGYNVNPDANRKNLSFQFNSQIFNMKNVHCRIKNVQIFCRDALGLIKTLDSEKALFYLDPPYPEANQDAYVKSFEEKDFNKLLSILKGIKGKFLLSCYMRPWMKFDKKWIIKHKKTKIHARNSRDIKVHINRNRLETLVKNYD